MCTRLVYSSDELYSCYQQPRPPSRPVRKTLFTLQLWAPKQTRRLIHRRIEREANNSRRVRRHLPRRRIRTGVWNVRSLGNCTTDVNDTISDQRLDLIVLTETWHRSQGDVLIRLVCPAGYTAVDAIRLTDPDHGGLAIVFRADFIWSSMRLPPTTTFECLGLRLNVDGSSLIVVAVYRPGSMIPSASFFDEMTTLLETISLFRCPFVVAGDFNIHVEDPADPNAMHLADLFDSFGLSQRVLGPTHQHGGTLDLFVVPHDMSDVSVAIYPSGVVSDHGLAVADLPIRPTFKAPPLRTVRGWRSLDRTAFVRAVAESSLARVPSVDETADELFSEYDRVFRSLADQFTTVRKVRIRPRPLTPWFDSGCRATRRECRRLERRYRRSLRKEDCLAWAEALRRKRSYFDARKNNYWNTRLAAEGQNSSLLWRSMNNILRRGKESGLPEASVPHTAEDFQTFFQSKVQSVRSSTAAHSTPVSFGAGGPSSEGPERSCLTSWLAVSTDEVRRVVMAAPVKSCSLDPVPTFLLRDCIDVVLPFLTAMVNASLRQGYVPQSQKMAVVTPLLKKASMDPQELKNYRPVSNLSFVSKLVERLAVRQLLNYLETNELLPPLQSAYRRHHSTETALLKVLSDIMDAADNKKVTLLALLDLSAAFDCVDHDILLSRLRSDFGLDGVVLQWIQSFLSDRTQRVVFGDGLSSETTLLFGVPQGSVLGPLLFLLYTAGLLDIIKSFGLMGHCYADDTQVYISAPAAESRSAADKLAACVEELDRWMVRNRLKMNAEKTQLIWLGTRQQVTKLTVSKLPLNTATSSSVVDIVTTAVDLGVVFDDRLTMSAHISSVCRSGFFQLRQLRSVRRSLTSEATRGLVQAFINSRLDYCNSLLAGVAAVQLRRLQSIQNAAARLVSGARRHDHIMPVLDSLHWLPVHKRVIFKTAVIVWKCLHGAAPCYLADLCVPVAALHGRRHLRSAGSGVLVVPRTRTSLGQRSFAFNGPTTWNSLPVSLRLPDVSLPVFKRGLKTHLFRH